VALISFDNQPSIATDQVDDHNPALGSDPERRAPVTIDSGGPTSSVAALPAQTFGTGIAVSWSGSDDGSGIASYSIYVRVDNGAFTPWLVNTTQTQAIYTGQGGHTYGFYSVATDNVGNLQPTPAGPQASTSVSTTVGKALLSQPTVQGIMINDGSSQRSMVDWITVTFNTAVTLGPGAITLTQRGGGTPFSLVITNANHDGRTYTIHFAGSGITGGSLADGIYDLTVHGGLVRNARGMIMDGDQTLAFHRLFGDTNGDGTVDALDMAVLRGALGHTTGQPGYVWWLDYDQNGSIVGFDGQQLRQRLGVRFQY
jgi:hypothetical protein